MLEQFFRGPGVNFAKTGGVILVNFFIYMAILVGGASVLAIELIGTRIIAPFYGAGLYLWSALISVTLAALSCGYAIGGWWADRGTRLGRFCVIIGMAGLWITAIPWMRAPVFAAAETMELRVAVLVTATILFFPPLVLLGMVSPYAIRLKASSLEVVGRTAGNLYAVSTMASVVAAIATGFFLIPNIGVPRLVFSIGILLIATALAGLAIQHKRTGIIALLLVLAVAGKPGFQAVSRQTTDPENGLIAVKQSAYAEIRVVDLNGIRYMFIDGSMHTGVDPVTWNSCFPYINVLDIAKGFFKQPGEMLLVGLGGGSVVKSYVRDDWLVDVVEIDPIVTQVAYEYFGLEEAEAQIYDKDGRQFLITHDKTYDIIIMDAFGSSSIPFHLVTVEAFGLIRSHLSPGGILAMNIQAVGWHDEIVVSIAATANRQFEHLTVLPIAEPPNQLGNIVLLASNRKLNLEKELPLPLDRFSAEYDRVHAWDNRFQVDVAGIQVLTDDLNPIDVWSERINLASRKELHEFFGKEGVVW